MELYDVCVIGVGGVVGSAIIRNLAARGLTVLGVERHDGPAREASGLNSRVIHSGFHEKPGTLKARLALAGSRMLLEYASAKGIPVLRTGMLIAVPRHAFRDGVWKEFGSVWRLWRGGRSHHIELRWMLSPRAVRRIAPIAAAGGIFIPSVCVVNVEELIASFQRDAIKSNAVLHYSTPVDHIERRPDRYIVHTGGRQRVARLLINSAGASANVISRMAGGPEYRLELIRGQYYELRGGIERWGIRTLVYPAVPPYSRSKGIHLGPRTDGRLFIGPDAEPAGSPPAPKQVFVDAAKKFLPELTPDDLEYSCEGIRPKYMTGKGASDFLIRLEGCSPPLINLIGIDSPGLSASMAIAKYVGDLLSSVPAQILPAA